MPSKGHVISIVAESFHLTANKGNKPQSPSIARLAYEIRGIFLYFFIFRLTEFSSSTKALLLSSFVCLCHASSVGELLAVWAMT